MNPVLAAFLEGLPQPATPPGSPPGLPLDLEVVPAAGNRVADVALLLGLIAAFWLIGRLLREAGLPRLRPSVFAAGLTGILMLFFTNTAFWMVGGVKADAERVTLVKYLGDDEVMRWSDLVGIELDSGKLYPAFSDDASLVLVGRGDQRLKLPRFVPGIAAIVPEVARHLPAATVPPATPAPPRP
ncbi:MAG: hypothetical protein U1F43_04810 [Myxococcota bacterium]